MLKKDLRLKYSKLRKDIAPQSLLNYSLTIANNLLELPLWEYEYYHVFLPILEKTEINTSFILSILRGKNKRIAIPKIASKNTLKHFLFTDSTKLFTNKWGIPEPVEGTEISASKIDVVFVPLLAYDKKGNRVGYGKGFYDGFLSNCRPNVVKVGLSMFSAEDVISDLNASDIPLDYCVTPEKNHSFSIA